MLVAHVIERRLHCHSLSCIDATHRLETHSYTTIRYDAPMRISVLIAAACTTIVDGGSSVSDAAS